MVAKIDRTGEIGYNNFGSKMIISGYRNTIDIDVYFPEYDITAKGVRYNNFKRGAVSCPYERTVYGVGYLGEGKYKVKENGKDTRIYSTWSHMLRRCHDENYQREKPSYKYATICEEFHNFQNFGYWDSDNFYQIEGEKMCLDKDILIKGNKLYSPETCIFVPERINTLFIKCDDKRGNYPVGVYYHKRDKKFKAQCSIYDFEKRKSQQEQLGYYNTPEEAFKVYKQFKENYIKKVADEYKDKIPSKLYNAMYNYKVEITD